MLYVCYWKIEKKRMAHPKINVISMSFETSQEQLGVTIHVHPDHYSFAKEIIIKWSTSDYSFTWN